MPLSTSDRNALALKNDRLALKIAYRARGTCPEPVEDLAQIARIGLLKASERFDPDRGAAFSSFAVPYIEGEIQHFLRDRWGLVKIPRKWFEEVAKAKKIQRQFQALGRAVELVAIAQSLGYTPKEWEKISDAVQRKPVANLDDFMHLSAEEEEQEPDRAELKQRMVRAIAILPRQQREILTASFYEGLSDGAIAKRHRLTALEVREIIDSALSVLKTKLGDLNVSNCPEH